MNKRCWVSRQRLECAAQDFKFGQLRVQRPAEIYLGNTYLGSAAIFAARAHARFLLSYLCRAHEKCYQTRTSLVEYAVEHAYGSPFLEHPPGARVLSSKHLLESKGEL